MPSRTVIEGNAFYEIDEDCLRLRREREKRQEQKRQRPENGEYHKETK